MAKAKQAVSVSETTTIVSALGEVTKAIRNINNRLDRLENAEKVETTEKVKAKVKAANAAKPESIPVLTEAHVTGKPITYRLPGFESKKTEILAAFRNKGFDNGCEALLPYLPDTNDKVEYNIEYTVKQRNKSGEPTLGLCTVWLNLVK